MPVVRFDSASIEELSGSRLVCFSNKYTTMKPSKPYLPAKGGFIVVVITIVAVIMVVKVVGIIVAILSDCSDFCSSTSCNWPDRFKGMASAGHMVLLGLIQGCHSLLIVVTQRCTAAWLAMKTNLSARGACRRTGKAPASTQGHIRMSKAPNASRAALKLLFSRFDLSSANNATLYTI